MQGFIWPMTFWKRRSTPSVNNPQGEKATRESLALPIYPELTADQIREVAAALAAALYTKPEKFLDFSTPSVGSAGPSRPLAPIRKAAARWASGPYRARGLRLSPKSFGDWS